MDLKKSDHPNRSSIESAPGDQSQNIDEEIEACVTIMNKPHALRTEEEVEMFAAKVASLQIFGRSLFENLEPKAVISKLMPFMKHEHFTPGQAIFNYEQPSDKMYIILRGKARELIPKTIDEIEAESHTKFGGTVNWPIHLPPPSVSEIGRGGADTPTSGSSLNSTFIPQKGLHSSLTAISEENNEENENLENAKKRFRKLKAVLPFLKKIAGEKTTVTNAEEYRYKKSIKKNRSILRPILSDEEINREALEAEFGFSIVKEFMRFPKAYFIGGMLKVRFSKYLYPGGQCGIRAMRDNSLRSRAVFAEEDCHCLSLHRDDFAAVIESEKALNSDKIEYFKKLFSMYDHRVVSEFSLLWENMMYKTNDIIYHQNDPSDYLYLLASGQVMFTKTMSEARKPKQFFSDLPFRLKKKVSPNDHTARVATISEGYFFGEQDFFEEQPHELTSVVISNKARVYRISLTKYKSRGKNYSDIMREIRRLLTLKTTWKNERLKDITEKHQQAVEIDKQKSQVQENLRDIDKNLLGLLSPDSQQASSNRLKLKVMEKAKAIAATSPALNDVKSPLKIEKSPTTLPIKMLKPKIYEISKSTGRLIPDYRFIVQPKRNKLDHLNSARPEGLDQSETTIFNRTRLPIQYNSKCEDLIKQDTEIVRLNFKENPNKRPGSQRIDSRRGLNRPGSQAKDGGITSSASLNILRKRVMNSGVAASVNDLRDFNEGRHNRAPSIELDTRVLVTEQDQHSVAATINAIPSLTDKHFGKFILANIKQNPQNTEKAFVATSLDQLDKPEKGNGSLNTLEGSTKNTLTKTTTEIGSLNKIMDEMIVSKHVSSTSALSPIHSRPKTRTSTQNLRATLTGQRRGSWKIVGDSMNIHVSKDTSNNSWQKSFRIQGENKSRTRYLTRRSDVNSLTNIKMAATVSDLNGIIGQSLL